MRSGLYGFFFRGAPGYTEVVNMPESEVAIAMVSADEAVKLAPQVLVYEAQLSFVQDY